jgi:hypothetical protein
MWWQKFWRRSRSARLDSAVPRKKEIQPQMNADRRRSIIGPAGIDSLRQDKLDTQDKDLGNDQFLFTRLEILFIL